MLPASSTSAISLTPSSPLRDGATAVIYTYEASCL